MAAAALLLQPQTPPDYLRVVSPTISLPNLKETGGNNIEKPVPVGLLACQRDPLLGFLTSHIISCSPQTTSPATSKKSKKGAAPPEDLLEVVTYDTIIFPEGGGQPSDIGLLTTADGKAWQVVFCKRRGGHAVHYVKGTENDLPSFVQGESVHIELGADGWDRRYDHMTLHTAQHLLSAVLDTYGLPTLSWSLTAAPAPCYVDLSRSLTSGECAEVQAKANKCVVQGTRVYVEVDDMQPGEKVAPYADERKGGKGVPLDYTGGVKRTVIIDGIDRSPCCGTHLPSLSNLQLFLIPPSTTTDGRLYFLAGPRLLQHLARSHAALSAAASTLSCGTPEVPARVELIVDERRKATKRVEAVEGELVTYAARDMMKEMKEKADEGKVWKKHYHNTSASLPFLSSLSTTLAADASPAARFVFVLSGANVLLIAGSVGETALVGEVGKRLKERLRVKGGGKGVKWSGKWDGKAWGDKEAAIVKEVLETSI